MKRLHNTILNTVILFYLGTTRVLSPTGHCGRPALRLSTSNSSSRVVGLLQIIHNSSKIFPFSLKFFFVILPFFLFSSLLFLFLFPFSFFPLSFLLGVKKGPSMGFYVYPRNRFNAVINFCLFGALANHILLKAC